MQLHELQPVHKNASARRVGRGGKRGKTSGRGHKGQKARAGNSTRPEMRDLIKKLPKLRGHGANRSRTVNSDRVQPVTVNVATLAQHFTAGETVSPKILVKKGVVTTPRKRVPQVKVLGDGDLTHKLTVTGCVVSNNARKKIEAAGGTIA
jgi:large subunit ribosomal protein L15